MAKLQNAASSPSNLVLAAPLPMTRVPNLSACSHPKCHATLLSRLATLGPAKFGYSFSPPRTPFQMYPHNEDIGRNNLGAWISNDSVGHFPQMHFLSTPEPPAMYFRLSNFITNCPFDIPTAAGGFRTESSPISPRGHYNSD